MKRLRILLPLVLVVACHSHSHDGDAEHGHAHGHDAADERPALSWTHWTEASELFIELPALVRGEESPCAAHVTKLEGFAALAEGRVSVVLRGDSGEERFDSQGPSVPGIFRPVVKPAAAGRRRLLVEIRAPGLSADHDLGDVTVFESAAAARAAIPEEPEVPGRIPFLKEQQWPIEFATALVSEHALRPTLRATGEVRARSDGEVLVRAPAAGRVATSGKAFPRLGQQVSVDDPLGAIAPRLEAADVASLELAVTRAELELRFAERERERLEKLRAEGAVPERRVEEAVHASQDAQASLEAARRRLEQFRRVQRMAGSGEGTVSLRAPLAGTITEVHVAPGAFVEAGAPLFRVTDLTQLWLEARVPEVDVGRLGTPRGASFLVEGSDEAIELPADALVARGHVIDPLTRTLPLVFAVDNAGARWAVGAFARVFLVNGEERRALAVPESSVVDDSGVSVVFVQVEGEAFERRVVRLGVRDRGQVEVLSGVRAGEHVVTRGAWSVKLAASSGSIPAHGHSH
ncbi:efflux RND transporter periplasmic adaptor subunit [Cystobacter fuscus]|uniref:efflux RND transporter periplasmic adaptor subunit n=1 Tax=Cystobacter fuscus TaxID=43 RepID=UPI002B30636E|nr:efflux RND transporter periplasmic adaptor subunit [Cystobacter fuscus]